jgi:hypothetical protein
MLPLTPVDFCPLDLSGQRHEVVHVFGSGDAYAEASRGMPGASSVYDDHIARVALSSQGSLGVGDIDIQMMLEAQITGQLQHYQTYTDIYGNRYTVSPAMK